MIREKLVRPADGLPLLVSIGHCLTLRISEFNTRCLGEHTTLDHVWALSSRRRSRMCLNVARISAPLGLDGETHSPLPSNHQV